MPFSVVQVGPSPNPISRLGYGDDNQVQYIGAMLAQRIAYTSRVISKSVLEDEYSLFSYQTEAPIGDLSEYIA